MAKQVGPIKFRGKLDDVCGRLTEDGVILQKKTGPRREQVLHDDNFINTRRNADEFGGAVDASTLLRRVLGHTVKAVKHAKLVSYMNKKLHAVAMSDKQSEWGDRCADKGDISLLRGFDYNQHLRLDEALPVKLSHALDVATGRVQLSVPGSLVRHKLVFPKEATHFRIVSCTGAVDFQHQRWSYDIAESDLLPLGEKMEALALEHQLVGKPGEVMLHTAGMIFYTVVDGEAELLSGGVLRVLEVERVATAVLQGTGTLTHMAEPHTCASVCVVNTMSALKLINARNTACASCMLDEEILSLFEVGFIEEEVDYAIVDKLPENGGEVVAVVDAEVKHFALGMVDSKGVVLEGSIAGKRKKQIKKKMGLQKILQAISARSAMAESLQIRATIL